MTRVATGWLVYRLTGSALLLGTVSFAGQIPTFLLAPFAGVWVDRLNRQKVLVWTQTLAMVQSLALAALTLSGRITIPWVLALSICQGLVNAFDMPGRRHSWCRWWRTGATWATPSPSTRRWSTWRAHRAVAGGNADRGQQRGWCFLIDGISYMAVIASLLLMRVHTPQ